MKKINVQRKEVMKMGRDSVFMKVIIWILILGSVLSAFMALIAAIM